MLNAELLRIIKLITNTTDGILPNSIKRNNECRALINKENGKQESEIEFMTDGTAQLLNATEGFMRPIILSLQLTYDKFGIVKLATFEQAMARLNHPDNSYIALVSTIMDELELNDTMRKALIKAPKTLEMLMENPSMSIHTMTQSFLIRLMSENDDIDLRDFL